MGLQITMDAQQELLRAVYEHFQTTAEWPATQSLQWKLRHLGHLPKLAAAVGKDKIRCDNHSPNGTCELTLRGIAAVAGGESDISHFLHTVRALVKYLVEHGSNDDLEIYPLIEDLSLSTFELQRLKEVIRVAPGLWRSLGSGEYAVGTITPSHNVWYFEQVETLDDYYAALQLANEDEREANRPLPGYTAPPPPLPPSRAEVGVAGTVQTNFVDETRLQDLRALNQTAFDLRRLIAMCEELNTCARSDCLHAIAMLTRAIIDHVPPIFNAKNFDEVANNYGGSKSFKDSMKGLATSARSIADGHLHVQIRRKEVLPTRRQVDFSHDIDVLLSEIVRKLS
jgi:hypothetical protein